MHKSILLSIILLAFGSCKQAQNQATSSHTKPRTIVTTDGEIDDVDSFIRMLLYANEFDIQGLVISSSMWHYKGDDKGTLFTSEMDMTKKIYGAKTSLRWPGTQWITPLLDAYGKIYPNLSLHAEGFPTADHLKSLVKIGNIDFEGEIKKDTEGSEFIKKSLLDDNTSPIYLQVWGGTNTIARALKAIEDQYKNTPEWKKIYAKVCQKAIIYAILDQDATYKKYIAPNWPDIKIYYNASQFWCFAYAWKNAVPPSQHYLFEGNFMANEIIKNHGPLLEQYYSYGDGKKQAGDDEHIHGDSTKIKNGQWGSFNQYDFISEGDSPAYLHLINVGLDNLENPHYGGWGGRLVQSTVQTNRWEDGETAKDYNPFTKKMDPTYPQIRWITAIQEDFAARADWCIAPYKEANHPPLVEAISPKNIKAKPGESIKLSLKASDPDGDQLEVNYWMYKEIGTYPSDINIQIEGHNGIVKLPAKTKGIMHIIAEVKDDAPHPMTRYQRFIINVE